MSIYSVGIISVGWLDKLSMEDVLKLKKDTIYACYKIYTPTNKKDETNICFYTSICPDVTADTYINNYKLNHLHYGINAVTEEDEIVIAYLNP